MKKYPLTIKMFGQNAIIIEWPNTVSEALLEDMLAFEQVLEQKLPNYFEFVLAYRSLTVINNKGLGVDKMLVQNLYQWYQQMDSVLSLARTLWTIPVCYDLEFGMDLENAAQYLSLSMQELVEMHCAQPYTVYGIGFLPGFMYLGGLPKKLKIPRHKEPRLNVPKGAVGLAGEQTGIYPQRSPGGWNIIGNCPVALFDVTKENPCFVKVGDKIQFRPISRAAYDLYKIEGEVGVLKIEKKTWHA